MKHIWEPKGLRAWLLGQFYRRRSSYQLFDGLLQNLRKIQAGVKSFRFTFCRPAKWLLQICNTMQLRVK